MRYPSFMNAMFPEIQALTQLKSLLAQGSLNDNDAPDIQPILNNTKTTNDRYMGLGPVLVL